MPCIFNRIQRKGNGPETEINFLSNMCFIIVFRYIVSVLKNMFSFISAIQVIEPILAKSARRLKELRR